MLTMTIDGRDFVLSAGDVNFLCGCMHAAMSHKGHRFERTHRSASGVFRVSAGETVRDLPAGVLAFRVNSAASDAARTAAPTVTDC